MTQTFTETREPGALKAPSADGSFEVVLITPGQGSSGYYSEDLIREYAPQAFPKGTHVYIDHLEPGQKRSTERLVGALIEDTRINEDGAAVNRLKPISKYREWVEDVRELVGLSISAQGEGTPGMVEGRQTLIVESLESDITNTVDIVPWAGRGGRFIESYFNGEVQESTQVESSAGSEKGNETTMAISEEQVTALVESVKELVAKMTAAPIVEEAPVDAEAALKEERAKAVEAAKAVGTADLTESVRDSLYQRIEAGDYDVASAIEADRTLREEIRADLVAKTLTEAGASASGGAASSDSTYVPKGW